MSTLHHEDLLLSIFDEVCEAFPYLDEEKQIEIANNRFQEMCQWKNSLHTITGVCTWTTPQLKIPLYVLRLTRWQSVISKHWKPPLVELGTSRIGTRPVGKLSTIGCTDHTVDYNKYITNKHSFFLSHDHSIPSRPTQPWHWVQRLD